MCMKTFSSLESAPILEYPSQQSCNLGCMSVIWKKEKPWLEVHPRSISTRLSHALLLQRLRHPSLRLGVIQVEHVIFTSLLRSYVHIFVLLDREVDYLSCGKRKKHLQIGSCVRTIVGSFVPSHITPQFYFF
ncbi:unnamed protein product [Ectocarpus sp. 13 AM-2016]